MRSLLPAILLAVLLPVEPGAGVVDYLAGAELQCENAADVEAALLFLLTADEDSIRTHLFPDYSGEPAWSLEEFLQRYFVPASEGASPGDEACREIVTLPARILLKRFYYGIRSGSGD